jgi:lactoylglutathione lyase
MTDHLADDGATPRLRHAMFPVRDLDRSIDFYTRILGMSVLRQKLNRSNGRNTAYVGYGGEQESTVLELVSGTGKEGMSWGGHIAVAVPDLRSICARMEAEGFRFARPLNPTPAAAERLVAYAYDPDGIEIELTQIER